MSLLQLFIGNFLNNCFFPFTVIYMCSLLIGKQKTRYKTLIYVFIYALGSSLILSLLTHSDIIRYHHISGWTFPLVNLLDCLMLFFLLYFLFPKSKKSSLLFLLIFQTTVYNCVDWAIFLPLDFFNVLIVNHTLEFLVYNFISPSLVVIAQLIGLYLLKEKIFFNKLYYLAHQSFFSITFFLLYQLATSLSYFYYVLNDCSVLLINAVFLLLVLILILAIKEIQSKQQIEQVKAQISEQNTYTHYLETIQKDLRNIQHDYKNMIAAVYAYAESDKPEEASHYIETHLLSVQENSELHLQQLQMLRKITNLELRNIILDFIATFDESIPLIIDYEADVLLENPSVIGDYLHYVASTLNLNTVKLSIKTKRKKLYLCFSGKEIEQTMNHTSRFISNDPKITCFKKIKNQEIFHHLEIAL